MVVPVVLLLLVSQLVTAQIVPGIGRFGHSSLQLPNGMDITSFWPNSQGTTIVFGGYDYDSISYSVYDSHFIGLKKDIFRIDVLADGNISTTVINARNTGPEARFYHGAVYDATGDRMIIFGGSVLLRYENTRTTSFKMCGREDVWAFDFKTLRWRELHPHTTVCALAPSHFISLILFGFLLLVPFA